MSKDVTMFMAVWFLLVSCIQAGVIDETGVRGGLVAVVGYDSTTCDEMIKAVESGPYVIRFLDRDAKKIAEARQHIVEKGVYGKVTANVWARETLPYTDNLVNLLIITNAEQRIPETEVIRVLAPRGVAIVDGRKIVKPVPAEIDDWTHYLHDADGNPVAEDIRIHNPKRMQWRSGPNHTRDHDALASISAMVSSGGRLFYIIDEAPTSLIHHPPQWHLVARDAFNGVVLWKREIGDWVSQLYAFRSGPVWLPRKLVAVGDHVYTTLTFNGPVVALNAVTGETVKEFNGTEKTEEILFHDGILLLAVGDPAVMNDKFAVKSDGDRYGIEEAEKEDPGINRKILVYNAKTGRRMWEKSGGNMDRLIPTTLCAKGGNVYYMDNNSVFCVDLETGKQKWASPFKTTEFFIRHFAPTLVASQKAVVCSGQKAIAAYSVEDGKELWRIDEGFVGFAAQADLFVIGDSVWTGPTYGGGFKGINEIDLLTGKIKRSFAEEDILPGGHHHRCYRNKATERYLLTGRRCVEFIDLEGKEHRHNWFIRGICQYGILPANGQLYVPPDPCRCFPDIKMDGLLSFVSENHVDKLEVWDDDRLTKMALYDEFVKAHKTEGNSISAEPKPGDVWSTGGINVPSAGDWPTYRHDIARSGSVVTDIPAEIVPAWTRKLGGRLGSSVSVGDKVFVAGFEGESVYCLCASSGKVLWRFIAGGIVDSPPSIYRELAIFGCRDGYVYAVETRNGELIWKFRGAPVDSLMMVDGRPESPWPVHGSVLVVDGVVYFAAGRSSFIDGGIHLFGINGITGEKVYQTVVKGEAPAPSLQPAKAAPEPAEDEDRRRGKNNTKRRKRKPSSTSQPGGLLNDLMISDGNTIRLQSLHFSLELNRGGRSRIMKANYGFLSDSWMHRVNWTLGGAADYKSPFGKLLVFDGGTAYGVQNWYSWRKVSPWLWPQNHSGHHHQKYARYTPDMFPHGVRLYAQENRQIEAKIEIPNPENIPQAYQGKTNWAKPAMSSTAGHRWTHNLPVQIRAMVLTEGILFAAGWKDSVMLSSETARKDTGDTLMLAFDRDSGEALAKYSLPAKPVFDGMIAANGRIFLTLQNGDVRCFAARQ